MAGESEVYRMTTIVYVDVMCDVMTDVMGCDARGTPGWSSCCTYRIRSHWQTALPLLTVILLCSLVL